MAVKPTVRRNGKGFFWDEHETARLLGLHKEKFSFEEIAERLSQEFGTARNAQGVQRRMEALGKKKKPLGRPVGALSWTPEQTQLAFTLLAEGRSHAEVVTALKVQFGVERSTKALWQHLSKTRKKLPKKAKKSESTALALAKPQTMQVASTARGDRVVVPDGRAISVDFPMGQVRMLLQGELPLKAIRGIAEALVQAAIA